MKRKVIINQDTSNVTENPREFSELLKDFNSLKHSVPANGNTAVRYHKLITGLAAILLIGFIIYNHNSAPTLAEENTTPNHSEKRVTESNIELPFWEAKVDNGEETTLISPSGVVIEVPQGAFSLKDQGLLKDSITLKLTQYDDALSILVSQIPMSYDSAGMKLHFQSDGMFNLTAYDQNNNEVQLKKDIKVHYPQTSGRTNSNTYILDNNVWSYSEHTTLTTYAEVCENTVYKFQTEENAPEAKPIVNTRNKTIADLEGRYEDLESSKPLEPRKQNLANYRFLLDVNPTEFPELMSFEDVIFEVKDSRFSWSIYEETWNDISVSKKHRGGRYLVTLKNTKRVEIFDVYPVLGEKDFLDAFSDYSTEMQRIEEEKKDISKRIKTNKKREQAFLAQLKRDKKHLEKVTSRKRIVNQLTANLSADTPYRSINLGELGVVNFDIGIPLPAKGIKVQAAFFISGDSNSVLEVNLINLEDNIYYNYAQPQFKEFRYMRGQKHLLVSILPDGRIAAYRGDLSAEKIKRGEPFKFELEISEATNLDDLRDFLGLTESI